jgi:hypothetical protein
MTVKTFHGNTYLVSYPHDTSSRANSYPGTRHEPFDPCFLRRINERYLFELRRWSDGTDDSVDTSEDTSELSIIFDLSDMNLDTTVSKLQNSWLGA